MGVSDVGRGGGEVKGERFGLLLAFLFFDVGGEDCEESSGSESPSLSGIDSEEGVRRRFFVDGV